jgi:DNA mismatch repair ATPase MutL
MIWNILRRRKRNRDKEPNVNADGNRKGKRVRLTFAALRLGEEMIAMTVCRHAVKADPLRYLEVERLIQDLLECDLPYCCPHGRPTMIQISLTGLGMLRG